MKRVKWDSVAKQRGMLNLSMLSKHTPVAFKAHVSSASDAATPRVMCATDLWGPSDHALLKALWLARTTGAELLLLHVVDGETPLRLTGRRADHAHTALEWRVRRWPDFKPRPAISIRVGNPQRTISRVAREWQADLIVLGSSRPRTMDRFLATTAERVAAEAYCAVLVVNRSSPGMYADAAVVAKSPCHAAALEHAVVDLEILKRDAIRIDASTTTTAPALLREPPELIIVAADRWPLLTSLFRRSAASLFSRSVVSDLLMLPHRRVSLESPCKRHRRCAAAATHLGHRRRVHHRPAPEK